MSDTSTDDHRTVHIPEHVASEIDQRISRTRFESVDDYTTLVLKVLLRELERQESEIDGESDADFEADTDADSHGDDAVRSQLESLGYL